MDLTVTQAEAALKALEEEYAALSEEEKRLEARLKEVEARRRQLKGWNPRDGEIARARNEFEHAKRIEQDAALPRVLVKSGWREDMIQMVLIKVTPKRIYLREIGGVREEIFDRDGKAYVGQILDVEALLKEHGK